MKIESLTYNLISELIKKDNNINLDNIYYYTDILFSKHSDLIYEKINYIDLDNSMYITCELDIKFFQIKDSMIVTFFNRESCFFEILMYEKDNHYNFFTKEGFNPDNHEKTNKQIDKTTFDLHGNLNVYYDSMVDRESLFHYRETGSLSLYNSVNGNSWKEIVYNNYENDYSLSIKNNIMDFIINKKGLIWKKDSIISDYEKTLIENIVFNRKYSQEEFQMVFNLGYDSDLDNEIFFIKRYNEISNKKEQKNIMKNGNI